MAVAEEDLRAVRSMLERRPTLVDAEIRGRASIRKGWGWGSRWGDPPAWSSCRAVHFAAYRRAELLELLIEFDADLDALTYEENNGWATPLTLTCWEGNNATLRLLLEAGANPNVAIDGNSSLHSAINHWNPEKIVWLLEFGAIHDLFSAAIVGDLEYVERELHGRVDIHARNRSLLEWASHRGEVTVGRYLLQSGAELTTEAALGLGYLDVVRTAVAKDPALVRTASLEAAVRGGQVEVATFLLAAGAEPKGSELWRFAAELPLARSRDMAELLVAHGADVNEVSWRTPLGMFATFGVLEAAELLLAHGAEIDLANTAGLTALQATISPRYVEREQVETARFLLEHGADVNALAGDGRTALDIATDDRKETMARLLRTFGGKSSAEVAVQ